MNTQDIIIGDILLHSNGHLYKVEDIMIGVVEGNNFDSDMVHKTIKQGGELWASTNPYPDETRNSRNFSQWRKARDFISIVERKEA